MSSDIPLLEKDQIVVGRPLPFSVFSAEGHLLLAAGRQVDSDRARQMLIKMGVYRSPMLSEERAPRERSAANAPHKPGPLTLLQKDYGVTSMGRRFAITMAPNETHEAYNAWVIGATEHSLILTAPLRSDGSLVAITAGQTWLCRTFQVTSAFRFRATVLKAVFEPYPHIHMEVPKQVEKRKVRGQPRANVFVNGVIEGTTTTSCVVLDLSVTGGRVAVDQSAKFERGQPVRLKFKVDLIDFHFDMVLNAHIAGVFGQTDARHAQVAFYGLQFEGLSELESLILHGFVNQHLAVELNSLWQVLSNAGSTIVT
jgi:hypothetical protein